MNRLTTSLGAILTLALATTPVLAATRTWVGSTSTFWSNASNWQEGVAPVNGDHLVFPATPNVTTNNDLVSVTLDSLEFRGSTLVLGNAITLTNSSAITAVAGASIVPRVILTARDATISVSGGGGTLDFGNGITVNGGTFSLLAPQAICVAMEGSISETSPTSISINTPCYHGSSVTTSGGFSFTGEKLYVPPDGLGTSAAPAVIAGNCTFTIQVPDAMVVSGDPITKSLSLQMSGPDALFNLDNNGTITLSGNIDVVGTQVFKFKSYGNMTGLLSGGKLVLNNDPLHGSLMILAGRITLQAFELTAGAGFVAGADGSLPSEGELIADQNSYVSVESYAETVGRFSCGGEFAIIPGGSLTATQSVDLRGCQFLLRPLPANYMVPDTIPLIFNNGSGSTVGTFTGLPEGTVVIVGGNTRYITYRGGDGNDVQLVSSLSSSPPPPVIPAVTETQNMWWVGPSENGWGMSLIQHNDTLFAALYVYDGSGNPTWLVMPGGSWDSTHTMYSGFLYEPTGSPFYAYDTTHFAANNPRGTLRLTFSDSNNATLDSVIDSWTAHKAITRERFGADTIVGTDQTDLWWGGASQNGWGITIMQQGSTLFPIWYTYGANGSPVWYVMPGGTWTSPTTYSGTLYRTTGSPWIGAIYDPSKLQVLNVGTFGITFNGETATFNYTADGHSGSIPLVREPF